MLRGHSQRSPSRAPSVIRPYPVPPAGRAPGRRLQHPQRCFAHPLAAGRPLPRSSQQLLARCFWKRPAFYPLSLPHNGQCGAGVAGRAGPGLSRVARQLGIRLGGCSAAVAIETEQQREAGRAAGWGWGPPGGGGAQRLGPAWRAALSSGRPSACPGAALPGRGPADQDCPEPRGPRTPRPAPPRGPDVAKETGKASADATSRAGLRGARQVRPPRSRPGRCDPAPAATRLLATGPGGRDLDAPPQPRSQWALGRPGGRGGRGLGDAETGAGGEREPTGRTGHGLQVSQVRQNRVLR